MKRSEHFYSFSNKRPKLQQDIDDIWGDDPEIDEVDRCINLATQICSQNAQPNTLNLTSYDDFKSKNIHSSTQAFIPSAIPSTSGIVRKQENNLSNSIVSVRSSGTIKEASEDEVPKLLQKVHILESEKKKLTETYETKNGEITILKLKLAQAQKAVDSEKIDKLRIVQENQQKWDSKLNIVNKELNSLKCDLNLKNLEMANLKEKLTELKKVCNSNLNMSIVNEELNISQVLTARNKFNGMIVNEQKKCTVSKNIQTEMNNFSYPVASITNYPLQNLIPQSVFINCNQNNTALKIKNITGKNSLISYRHNFTTLMNGSAQTSNEQNLPKTEENELICLNDLYPDIQKLVRYTEEELNNSKEVNNFVLNILNLSKNNLIWMLNQLHKINQKLSYDDVENINQLYLEHNEINYQSNCIFSGTLWHDSETAVDIRRYIAILSSLVFHSQKLHKYFITQSNESNISVLDEAMEIDGATPKYEFLNLLLEVVTVIKNIRRSEQFCGFLSAVLKLLGNVSSKQTLPAECYDIINTIFKQIIFSRPSKPVLKYVCEFLKHLSSHNLFITKLCTLKKCETTQSSSKEGLIFFSQDSCPFKILSTELETCDLSIEMAFDVIQFLTNSATCNVFWMYHQEEQRCECLVGVYSLGIVILYNTLEKNSQINHHTPDTLNILRCSIFRIGLIFLDILTARIPDLVIRSSQYMSQYQTIIKYISKIQKHLCLQKAHETALEDLVSQFNYDVQKTSQNKNIDFIFNNSFT